jgi:hypothetical protein
MIENKTSREINKISCADATIWVFYRFNMGTFRLEWIQLQQLTV